MAKETVTDYETQSVEKTLYYCDTCGQEVEKFDLQTVAVNPEFALRSPYLDGFNRNTVTSPADVRRMVEIDVDHEYDVCLSCLDESAAKAIQGASRPVETTDEDETPTFGEWLMDAPFSWFWVAFAGYWITFGAWMLGVF